MMVKTIYYAIFATITFMISSFELAFSSESAKPTIEQLQVDADKGNPAAQYMLGNKFYYNNGAPKDNEQALLWWQKSADGGYPPACVALGLAYENGVAVKQDFHQAVQWYNKAVAQKDPEGEFLLALCYAFGRGVPTNVQKAVQLCETAATAGLRQAQRTRGLGFYWGDIGYTNSYTNAIFWLKKAAGQGDPPANYYLGLCYENGKGTETNLAEATKCFRFAADSDYADAEDELGTCYVYGRDVEQDPSQAVVWYKKAADQGNPDAQIHLGLLYVVGDGVEKDPIEAYKWFTLAGMKDQKSANIAVEVMEQYKVQLTSAEKAEAIRRASLFKVTNPHELDNPNGLQTEH